MYTPLQNAGFPEACMFQAANLSPVCLMRQASRCEPEHGNTRALLDGVIGGYHHARFLRNI